MKSFDVLAAVQYAFTSVWGERAYLLRLAAAPLLIKFLCFVTVLMLDIGDQQQLRIALILLPAFFAEGWMLAHWSRYIFLGQRWPFKPSGDDQADMAELDDRARGILSATIMYVLIQMALAGLWAGLFFIPVDEDALQNPPTALRVASIAAFVVMLWGFRYMWVFIPMAVNIPMRRFLTSVQEPRVSLTMAGTWILCCLPGFTLMMMVTLPAIFADSEGAADRATQFIGSGAHVAIETVVTLLAVSGLGYGIKVMLSRKAGQGQGGA